MVCEYMPVKHGCARGQAERIDDERVVEGAALVADAIEVGRVNELVAGGGQRAIHNAARSL